MKHKNHLTGVERKNPLALKLAPIIFWILVARSFPSENGPIYWYFWALWLYTGVFVFVGSPDFVFYEKGIEIKTWWMRGFVKWDNVHWAYSDGYKTRIHINEITPPNFIMRTFVYRGLVISRWDENYYSILRILEEYLGNRFIGVTEQKR
jgi:hypothetical protein